ncbi:hypothetical protein CAPTEDRAFT_183535 [Capitella teleta]|uniref:TBC1 domain family member 23 n=1 Tax=Capitella teleta TaxID=283909 RepID=R7VAU5_CAPTE|nr:hypothetical protein CAPTEDRAFT_183535 [Capitella teleta]|eukprot:ELU13461.1 hypothetical protein CAPTEDRAFT_183535 [Capitella teleta]
MPEQNELREDCHTLVDELANEEDEKLSVSSDLESILTFYCKSRALNYAKDNGWLNVLQPMLAMKYSKADLYNCFYAFITKYIPRECHKNGKPFHLFRLLLQYHDPELCSFLDTKKITPDTYAQNWFSSLFAASCDLKVILSMWDVYLQHTDPFLVFFLALVIIVNAKDQILSMDKSATKQEIIDKMTTFPSALAADDVEDFCALAQYYSTRTPQSFRRDYQGPLFGTSLKDRSGRPQADLVANVSQMLCLPVSVSELLQANQEEPGDQVRYFVVDCRPAEQYNAGHLSTAFHLDANLMLHNPQEFSTAAQALLSAQRQAIAAGSVAGGDHLCFLGSGREEEDQYVHMVVAHFLQRNSQFVSLARGGYTALHEQPRDLILTDHVPRNCLVCNPQAAMSDGSDYNEDQFNPLAAEMDSIKDKFGKLSSVVISKGGMVKDKMINYIKNEQSGTDHISLSLRILRTHVSSEDRVGKRYRNTASVFSIGDEDEDDPGSIASSDDEKRDTVNIDTWLHKPDVRCAYHCQEVRETGFVYPSHLLVTNSHLYILREMASRPGMAWIQGRRALGSIVKITSKKKHPELITFKYGSASGDSQLKITNVDRFIIPKAAEATKCIKEQIMRVLDALES